MKKGNIDKARELQQGAPEAIEEQKKQMEINKILNIPK